LLIVAVGPIVNYDGHLDYQSYPFRRSRILAFLPTFQIAFSLDGLLLIDWGNVRVRLCIILKGQLRILLLHLYASEMMQSSYSRSAEPMTFSTTGFHR